MSLENVYFLAWEEGKEMKWCYPTKAKVDEDRCVYPSDNSIVISSCYDSRGLCEEPPRRVKKGPYIVDFRDIEVYIRKNLSHVKGEIIISKVVKEVKFNLETME